jgi:thiol:disulfide interchange protein DsbG
VNRRRFVFTVTTAAVAATLAACGDKATSAPPTAAAAPKPSAKDVYEMAGRGSGFTVGPVMAANTVYVFFDPACPHCASLWMNAKPLANRLKMVWIPIGFLQRSSAPQGATILTAPDPIAAMGENEVSVLERRGGITVSPSLSDEALAKVKANTELFGKTGEESVPLIVYRHGKTGEYGAQSGAVPTEQLAAMAGV